MLKKKAEVMKDVGRVLRRKIIIQKYTEQFDEWGDPISRDWVDWKAMWAERTSLWGRDYYAAAVVGEEQTVEFTVRFVPFLDEIKTDTHRLLFNDDIYDIKQVDFLKDDGMWVKIKALRRR